ncbi:MAG TPA: hypothetical protein VJU61_16425 [Polyangiaceae bacterium]|nr:hypothetical protein [Polyangiaceae bacterium]
MSVQQPGIRRAERWVLSALGALLAACGGRTLESAADGVSQSETAQEATGLVPGAVPIGVPPSSVAGAGGAPAVTQPATGGAGGWAGASAVFGGGGAAGGSWTGAGGSVQVPGASCGDPYFPEPDWAPSAWVALALGGGDAGFAPAPSPRSTMLGSWRGIVRTPWTSPYLVDITFDEDGHYSASTPELGDCVSAFYYGTDDDTPIKQWRVGNAPGVTSGEIDIAFDYGTESGAIEYGLPAWQGELAAIERDASGDGLRFEFSRSDGYGPLRFDLRRVE